MPVIHDLPLVLDPGAVAKALRLDIREGGPEAARELIAVARPLLEPRALYEAAEVGERAEETVEIGGRIFHSRVLARALACADRAFPFVLTVGGRLERAASASGDLLRQYQLEAIADLALLEAGARLEAEIRARFSLASTGSLSPGSLEDWPLTEQPGLFGLLGDPEKGVGVRLTESLLMVPRKSVSGIVFPAEEAFVACRLCPREACQGRRRAFDPRAREDLGLP